MASQEQVVAHCLVMCGEWRCKENGEWEFVLDKHRMTRIVTFRDGVQLAELSERVVTDFGLSLDGDHLATLSYRHVVSGSLVTSLKTPPILLSSDDFLCFFLSQLVVNKFLNLFVRFHSNGFEGEPSNNGGYSAQVSNKRRCFPTTPLTNTTLFTLPEKAKVKQRAFLAQHQGCSKTRLVTPVSILGVDLNIPFGVDSDKEIGPETPIVDSPLFDLGLDNETDIRPRGYNKNFWGQFIGNEYGGSNVVEVMCSPKHPREEAKWMQSKDVLCETGSCFDHVVRVNGECSYDANIPKQERFGIGLGVFGYAPAATVKLSDLNDEEFDIPPIFDDSKYETEDIPDLDQDPSDDNVYVGKLYGSKEDCQISLAISVVRKQITFKQTRTTRDYFVLTCPDERCDWRIKAQEDLSSGNYEIKNAHLQHICDIDVRNAYKKKVTFRVIAAVCKAKFGDSETGPRAMDVQQL